VTIIRRAPPGRVLAVVGSIRRRGVLFVLACFRDGSRARCAGLDILARLIARMLVAAANRVGMIG